MRTTRVVKARCCGNMLPLGTEITEFRRVGPKVVYITTNKGHVHKIAMREKSDLLGPNDDNEKE